MTAKLIIPGSYQQRFKIRYRTYNVRHVVDGTEMERELLAFSREGAMLMFKHANPGLEVLSCEPCWDTPSENFMKAGGGVDVSKPTLIKK